MTEAEKLVAQFKEERQARGFYTVAIYLIDRAYGGPEEGGWYYDCGTPYLEPEAAAYFKAFDNLADANDYATRLNTEVLPDWNEGRAERSRVVGMDPLQRRNCEELLGRLQQAMDSCVLLPLRQMVERAMQRLQKSCPVAGHLSEEYRTWVESHFNGRKTPKWEHLQNQAIGL